MASSRDTKELVVGGFFVLFFFKCMNLWGFLPLRLNPKFEIKQPSPTSSPQVSCHKTLLCKYYDLPLFLNSMLTFSQLLFSSTFFLPFPLSSPSPSFPSLVSNIFPTNFTSVTFPCFRDSGHTPMVSDPVLEGSI